MITQVREKDIAHPFLLDVCTSHLNCTKADHESSTHICCVLGLDGLDGLDTILRHRCSEAGGTG